MFSPTQIPDGRDRFYLTDHSQQLAQTEGYISIWLAHLNDFGATIIMPNAILDCIIDSAHHCKIQTIQDLKRETGWTDAEKFGDEVVVIVRAHAPMPFATNPLRPLTAVPHPTVGSSMRKNKCSACRQEGHNGNVISHFFMDYLILNQY
ncbi:hypothetical protein BDR07DRAFT_1277187 [Suillus spraguei]|nr:hypothetical protein BDR07DRAFT_1277187 [Suillus spraguei]